HQAVQSRNELNHYKFIVPTNSAAPTGNWEAVVSVGGAKFYKTIKIETIKPNRLKIKNSLAEKTISAKKQNSGNIEVAWLHGAVAKNLKLEMQGKIMKNVTAFSKYPSYKFDNPTINFSTEEINLYSGKINDLGQTTFTLQPNIKSEAPGMLKMAMITKAYEEGGDFSTDVATATYSPFTTYVGLKTPEPNKYGMLETGAKQQFEVVTVDENGRPKKTDELNVSVYKVDYRWWWRSSDDDLSDYNASSSKTVYYTTTVSTDASGKGSFTLNTNEDDWGRYLILVSDEKGGHTTGETIYIDYPYWSAKTKNGSADNATMLLFASDKQKYNVGEKAKISFPSSEGCRALLSIENGSKVLSTQWIETTKNETQVEVEITEKMTPNVYLHITLLQPHSFTKNDLPIRLYGILPIEVINKNTILNPIIKMPEVLRPEQTASISVSEKDGKAMSYTIAIVDEGLLDLTRFKTPNAWNSFNAKEALGVKTWDVYDEIIGAFSGKVSQLFSIGGDQEIGGGKAKKANRFKPVVIYLGPFKLEKGKTATHTVKLPNYIGSVKTMVVAANAENGAYGAAEKVTPVRSPLMILASFPRKISPSEKITLPVTVFAMENNVKNVTLQLKTNNLIQAT
ncbi:MAG TPA: alpha-2-macroglobulin family protein, partial [Chitinophagales bacterium]